jgi:hypothetical protein
MVYFTNLVEALWERQDAIGYTRTDFVFDQVTETTNSAVITSSFGVSYTNYVLVWSTNSVTNEISQQVVGDFFVQLDAAMEETIEYGSCGWIGPWWFDANDRLNGEWLRLTNSSGAYPNLGDRLPHTTTQTFPVEGALFAYANQAGICCYTRLWNPGADDFYHDIINSGMWTANTNENIQKILAWGYAFDTNITWRATKKAPSGWTQYPEFSQTVSRKWVNPTLTLTYGGTNTIAGSTVLVEVVGSYFTGTPEIWFASLTNSTETATVTSVSTTLSNYWRYVLDLNIVGATPSPNVGTTNALHPLAIDGGDLWQVINTNVGPIAVEFDEPETVPAWIDGVWFSEFLWLYINERYYILDMMRVIGCTQEDSPNGNSWDVTLVAGTNNHKTASSGWSNTWADAKTGAIAAWSASPSLSGAAMGPIAINYGEWRAGPEYRAFLRKAEGYFTVDGPASSTNYSRAITLYLEPTDQVEFYPTTHSDLWGYSSITNLNRVQSFDSNNAVRATNALQTTSLGPVFGDGLTNPPTNTWCNTPSSGFRPVRGVSCNGGGYVPPAHHGWHVTIDFTANTNGFQYVSTNTYPNTIWTNQFGP